MTFKNMNAIQAGQILQKINFVLKSDECPSFAGFTIEACLYMTSSYEESLKHLVTPAHKPYFDLIV